MKGLDVHFAERMASELCLPMTTVVWADSVEHQVLQEQGYITQVVYPDPDNPGKRIAQMRFAPEPHRFS